MPPRTDGIHTADGRVAGPGAGLNEGLATTLGFGTERKAWDEAPYAGVAAIASADAAMAMVLTRTIRCSWASIPTSRGSAPAAPVLSEGL
jgi:hypothetical protein